MKKSKVKAPKAKTKRTKGAKGFNNALYATEHDFIIIAGGGVIVMMLTLFLFLA